MDGSESQSSHVVILLLTRSVEAGGELFLARDPRQYQTRVYPRLVSIKTKPPTLRKVNCRYCNTLLYENRCSERRAIMPPYQHEGRVNNGLESLINAILPSAASSDSKRDAFDLAKEILEDQGELRGGERISS